MIELRLPLPPTTNHLFATTRRGSRVKSEHYRKWIKEAGQEILAQLAKQQVRTIGGTVELYMGVIFPDRRRRDISNTIKALEDLLCKHRIIEDDSRVYKLTVERLGVDAGTAGVRVIVLPWKPLRARIAA